MKNTVYYIFVCIALLSSCKNNTNEVQERAVAFWSFSNFNDQTVLNSKLQKHGNVQLITPGDNGDYDANNNTRDGEVVKLDGSSWLEGGQGERGELNIAGDAFSIYVRMKADSIAKLNPLLTKNGDDQSIAYDVSLRKDGNSVVIETLTGSDQIGGANLLKYKLPKNEWYEWHDIVLRCDGRTSQLYVDGILRDKEITVGTIRDWNRRPVLIGAVYAEPYHYGSEGNQLEATFNGLIDCVGIWDSYLSDTNVAALSGRSKLKSGLPVYYSEKYRPQFHFTAKKNWINDPNGLFYYKGVYHLFFQYMPPHRPGPYKDWGHAISKDLVHWKQIPYYLTPHEVWGGCWTGSAVVDKNNMSGFQRGDEKPIVAIVTLGGSPDQGLGPACTQDIAYSTDGGRTFTYYDKNPVIDHIYAANRDPKVVWDAKSKKWIMSLFMDKGNEFGIFGSSDLKHWKHLSTVSIKGVRECPGLIPLPVDGDSANIKWWFYGANGDYVIGDFDGEQFKPLTKVLRSDYGENFYAAQTWNNAPDDRCIMIAWMPTQRYPNMPFEQQLSFPTDVYLKTTPNGLRIFKTPVHEIEKLYKRGHEWNNVQLKQGDNLFKNLHGDLYDITLAVGGGSSSFTVGVRGATIHYDAALNHIVCGGPTVEDRSKGENRETGMKQRDKFKNNLGEAPLNPGNGRMKLRILIDRTSIEVFVNNGRRVITTCFMPVEKEDSYFLKTDGKVEIIKAMVHALESSWNQQISDGHSAL